MPANSPRRFATTRWSLILAVRDPAAPEAVSALGSLCEIYWFPVYAFIRRTGASSDEAGDLTQAFFTRVIEHGFFAQARQERGRFRSFLLTAVRHFLSNEREAAHTQKRGGGRQLLPLDVDDSERRYLLEPIDEVTPEQLYERRWAMTVLEAARQRTADKYADPDRRRLFVALQPSLTSHEASGDTITAADLGMTDAAFRVAAHRLRKHFEQCLRDVIRETVARPEDVDSELQHILKLSAGAG